MCNYTVSSSPEWNLSGILQHSWYNIHALGCGWEEALLPASPSAIITWSVGSEAGSLFLGVHVGSPVFLLIEPLDILVSTGIM